MKVFVAVPTLLSLNNTGVNVGIWVAESNYVFNVISTDLDKSEHIFQIWAKLNVEFEAGGSVEYVCEVSYFLHHCHETPTLQDFMLIAENTAPLLNEYFGNNQNIWISYDRNVMAELIQKTLSEFYPSF